MATQISSSVVKALGKLYSGVIFTEVMSDTFPSYLTPIFF